MPFTFKAIILKAGINPYVDVPEKISTRLTPVKGYIPVKGQINKYSFNQTLVPVKNGPYRLYVNGPMLKGGKVQLGDTARFSIEQNVSPQQFAMPKELKIKLTEQHLMSAFNKLAPYRQKEILRYLGSVKTAATLSKNVDKVIDMLSKKESVLPVWLTGKAII
jgi:hypothetical protein